MNINGFDRLRRSATPIEVDHIEAYAKGRISRREFVRRGTVIGLSLPFMSAILAACGSSSGSKDAGTTLATGTAEATTLVGATETTAAAAGQTIKQGGTLRIASQKPGSPLDPYDIP